jgi:hypothetical protein
MPELIGPVAGPWRALHPRDAPPLLAPIGEPWWIAGGWALDLFVGAQTRPHRDLDIGIARASAPTFLAALPGWEFFEAQDGALYRLGDAPRMEVNSLWGRRLGEPDWMLELMLDDVEHGRWRFRRAPSISLPLDEVIHRDADGLPYLAPEVQLLYKTRRTRAKDHADFARVSPLLDLKARTWLEAALEAVDPEHPWRGRLNAIR